MPLELAAWFSQEGPRYRTILLDCVTLWLSNLIGSGVTELAIEKRVAVLLKAMRTIFARQFEKELQRAADAEEAA